MNREASDSKSEVLFYRVLLINLSCGAKAHPSSSFTSLQEEKLKGKPGYEHLSEPLHVLIEAELPEDIINSRLEHAVHFLESLLKPMVHSFHTKNPNSSIWLSTPKPFVDMVFVLLSTGRINGPLQEGTAEGVSGSEWYTKGRESEPELEPVSESEHVPFQQQAC